MKGSTSRFERPSSPLEMKSVYSKTKRALWPALIAATGIHLSFTQIPVIEREQKAAKPLSTRFVKRQPRLTKPLELRKRPQPRRRQVQRTMVTVEARADRQQGIGPSHPWQVLRGLAPPRATIRRATHTETSALEPTALAQIVEGKKETRDIVETSLEMVDLDALDTGRYWALVVEDPRDKRQIKGFLHLASAYPAAARRPGSEVRRWPIIIKPLIEAMNRFTAIRTDYQGRIGFDSRELLKVPFLYTRIWWVFSLTDSELSRLGDYLANGGFLFAETISPGRHNWLPAHETVPIRAN